MKKIINIYNNLSKHDFIYSIIGTIIFYSGRLIFYNQRFNILKFILFFLIILLLLLIIKNIYLVLRNNDNKPQKTFSKKQILILMIPIIILYLLCYIGYFPGILSYDSKYENSMIVCGGDLSNIYPITYTLIWKLFYKIELLTIINNFRIIIYTLFQLTFILFTIYYLLKWLIDNKLKKKIIIIIYLYFLLNPVLHLMAIITSKDVIVAYLLLLLLITIIDLNNNFIIKKGLALYILGLLCLLFTNNFAPLMIIIILILFFYHRKISLILLNCLLSYSVILIILPLFNIRYTPPQEVLSIPIVQMSYVYNKTNTYSISEKQKIKTIIPNIDNYNPRFVDPIKNDFDYIKYHNSNIFWKMYFKGFKNNIIGYLKSFLNLNIRLWYPQLNNYDSNSKILFIEDDSYSKAICIEDDSNSKTMYAQYESYKQKNNIIYKYYHIFTSPKTISKIPFLNIFLSYAFPFWFLLTSLYLYRIKKYDKTYLIVNIFLLSYLLLYLFGPVTTFRYLFYFYVCLPISLIGLFTKKESDKYEEK